MEILDRRRLAWNLSGIYYLTQDAEWLRVRGMPEQPDISLRKRWWKWLLEGTLLFTREWGHRCFALSAGYGELWS